MVGSHKVAGKSSVNTVYSQIALIVAILSYTYHTKQLNPWPTCCVVVYCWLSTHPGKIKLLKVHPSICAHLTSLRNKA